MLRHGGSKKIYTLPQQDRGQHRYSDERVSTKTQHLLLASLGAILTFAVFYPFAAIGLDFGHDGIMLKPALDVHSGQVLFRDTFSQYGALTTWLHAACLHVDPRLLSLRIFTVVIYAASVFLLLLIWLRFSPWPVAGMGLVLFLVTAPFYDERWLLLPWSSAVVLVFQAAAAYSLCRCISDRASFLWPALLGATASLAVWARPFMVGISLSIALAAIWFLLGRARNKTCGPSSRQWAIALTLFIGGNLLFLALLAVQGALHAWLEQNVLWAFRGYAGGKMWGTTAMERFFFELQPWQGIAVLGLFSGFCFVFLISRWALQKSTRLLVIPMLAVAICIAAVVYVWKYTRLPLFPEGWAGQPGGLMFFFVLLLALGTLCYMLRLFQPQADDPELNKTIASYAVISMASLTQFYPTFSLPQQWWSVAPSCGLLAYFFWVSFGKNQWVSVLVFGALLLPTVAQKARLASVNLSQQRVELLQPEILSGMKVSRSMAAVVHSITTSLGEYSRAEGQRPIAVIGDDPMYGVFAEDTTNPTAYYVEFEGLICPQELSRRHELIKRTRPVVVFASPYKAIDKRAAESFCAENNYEKYFSIAYRPIDWWIGGQPDRLGEVNVASENLSAVILVPRKL